MKFLFLLSLSLPLLRAQQYQNITFNFTGPQPCPQASDIEGYSNITTMNQDMLYDAYIAFRDTKLKPSYAYTLCPYTTYNMEATDFSTSIMPLLNNTRVSCGAQGKSSDSCILEGGALHVLFGQGLLVHNVILTGLTFTANTGVSVGAWAYPLSIATFVDCVWKDNREGVTLLEMYYTVSGRRMLRNEENKQDLLFKNYQKQIEEDERMKLMRKWQGTNNYFEDNQRKLQGIPSMEITIDQSLFQNNQLQQALILNGGGKLQTSNTKFIDNRANVFSIGGLYGAQLFFHPETSFRNTSATFFVVYVDSNSRLELNNAEKPTTQESNKAQACSDGIFLENDNSYCLYQGGTCHGACCAFGNITCDQFISSEEAEAKVDTDVDFVGEKEDISNPSPGAGNSEGTVAKTTSCDALCISLSVILPMLALVLAAIAFLVVKKKRRNRAPALGNEPANTVA